MKYSLGFITLSLASLLLIGCSPTAAPNEDADPANVDTDEPTIVDEPAVDGESNISNEPVIDSLEDNVSEGSNDPEPAPTVDNVEPIDTSDELKDPAILPTTQGGDVPLTAPGNSRAS